VAGSAKNFGAGLVGWWNFDECTGTEAEDLSGMENDGLLSGAAVFTDDALLGCAVDFTGLDGAVLIPHDPSLEPVTGTVEVWVKVDVLQDSDIVMKTTDLAVRTGVPCGCSVIGIRITADGGAVGFVMNDDPTTPGAVWRTALSPSGLITAGVWHHLALRWNGATVDIFVDGIMRASEPYDPVPGIGLSYHNGSPVGLGVATAWGIPGSHEFIGQMDDVRFYGKARRNVEIFTDFVTKGHKPAKPLGQ
jgi:hypothetical protein